MKLKKGCVLAYSVNEINVELSDGTFQLVQESDNKGGFKGEEQEENLDVLGKWKVPGRRRSILMSLVNKKFQGEEQEENPDVFK